MKTGKQEDYQYWTLARQRKLITIANKFWDNSWNFIADKLNSKMKTHYSGDACRHAYNYYA